MTVRATTVLLALVCAACTVRGRPLGRPDTLSAAYQLGELRGRASAATRAYRTVLARSLYSDCRMLPSDSAAFERRSRRCGALPAAIAGISRLFMETAATPAYFHPLVTKKRLRWWDPPYACF